MNSSIVCNDIKKSFGKVDVLKGVSLEIAPHKIYGLLGRNGAGKTTLLGIISGQNIASDGSVTLNEKPVWQNQIALDEICFSREINTNISFGQDSRKVKEILALAAALFKYWDNDYAKLLIKEFELDEKKRLNKLSKGMLSAVTIIIALASKAPFTFIDEPVAGLDVFMRDKFYKLLMQEFCETERTFIISTHIIEEISGIIEDVVIINEGKILKNCNCEDLLQSYRIISGKTEDIDEFCKNYTVVHSEEISRSKTVCVEIIDEEKFKNDISNYCFDVSKANLQKLFMQLL